MQELETKELLYISPLYDLGSRLGFVELINIIVSEKEKI